MMFATRVAPRSAPIRTLALPHTSLRSYTFIARARTQARCLNRSSTPLQVSHVPARTFIRDGKGLDAASRKAPRFAFAFDIDGVLLHVAKPIPGATETLEYLQRHDIPFILLTNGGGKHEHERVEELSARLGVPLSTENFVQSHTPFQELVSTSWSHDNLDRHIQKELLEGDLKSGLADKNILITGSDPAKSRLIAEAYGFRSVITPADIAVAHPTVFPFELQLKDYYAATARPLPSPNPKIDAIFVFNDPRDWAVDIQVIVDLLLSQNGVLGTYSPKNGRAEHENHGWQTDGQPHLYFSNHDLFWSAAYHLPRFGQGAFQAALAGIWRQITGGKAEMRRTTIGKPYPRTYEFAETVLAQWRAALLKKSGRADAADEAAPLARVYMVGDNPESDIRGANEYDSPHGTEWSSILVRTGVWSQARDGEPKYRPTAIADDAKAAVQWALEREGWR
ncbi:HAD-like domain-containing protein [Xylaria bambusicola]|uniref:HAD-like domain-containing protein n=1 Tax=Xylaria bambusicola TaxID=326684 RepID=UPI0020080469|nr:HAD-like domain-containing protein [Xylaria bambusicola]KAI0522173.1 HAD-like domain-containing protein [Xylaria bambusicola]